MNRVQTLTTADYATVPVKSKFKVNKLNIHCTAPSVLLRNNQLQKQTYKCQPVKNLERA